MSAVRKMVSDLVWAGGHFAIMSRTNKEVSDNFPLGGC